jgi:hypothetical protein
VSALLALSAAAAQPAWAQNDDAFLRVCNRGKVPVEVVDAHTNFLDSTWTVEGATVAPGRCELVYEDYGPSQRALVGFGFTNARGEFVSGRIGSVPDWGTYEYSSLMLAAVQGKAKEVILAHASGKTACVHADATLYSSNDATFPAALDNCRQFSVTGPKPTGSGGFYPLTFALDFHPAPSRCRAYDSRTPNAPLCGGGNYYMNVDANPASGEVAVTTGTLEGSDAPAGTNAAIEFQNRLNEQLASAVAKAAKEAADRRAAAAAAADPIARADAANKAFEARQSGIDYKAEHERNLRRIRDIGAFSPQWTNSTEPLYVRGTVSRIDPPKRRGEPARMYFKESPDGAFIACVWPQLFGDLNQFVGERLEVRGRVTRPTCGGTAADLQVSIPAFVYELDKGLPDDEAILPGMAATSAPPAPPRPVGRDRNDRADPAQRPRNDVPPPASGRSSSAAAARASVPLTATPATASTPIPPGTRIDVTLMDAVDLARANSGDTFRAQTLRPIALPGNAALPQGTAIVLRFLRTTAGSVPQTLNGQQSVSAGVTLQSVEINGQAVPVSSNAITRMLPAAGAPNFRATYPAGMRLAFVVTAMR